MFTLPPSAIEALDSLGLRSKARPAKHTDAMKLARRAARHARFDASIRDGLRYSRAASRRIIKPKGDGGAVPEWRMKRIIP